MKIEFAKEQFKDLLRLVHTGNWMINAIRSGGTGDERINKYDALEQYIFSLAGDFGFDEYVEFDESFNRFFPGRRFEEDEEIERYREEYDDEVFWQELVYRLADRDFRRKYGNREIAAMSTKEKIEKDHPFLERYGDEISEHGIGRLEINEEG